jgi:hypothetical protein
MSTRSKTDRAIVAYLISKGVAPNIYPANFSGERAYPNVTVWCHDGKPDVQYSGSWEFQVMIEVNGHATVQPDEPNPDAPRVDLDEISQAVEEALMVSDDADQNETLHTTAELITLAGRALAVSDGTDAGNQRAANNADMVNFTLQFWQETGLTGGQGQTEGAAFREILNYICRSCGSNVD